MDINIIDAVTNKYGLSSFEPVFVSDNELNIPDKLYDKLNKTICYDFNMFDGYDMSHTYMSRVYNGTIHDKESTVRYTKAITTKVIGDSALSSNGNKLMMKRIRINKNAKNQVKTVTNVVYSMVNKFILGEVGSDDISISPLYSDEINLLYLIGKVSIFQSDPDDHGMISYVIAIPYNVISNFIESKKIG